MIRSFLHETDAARLRTGLPRRTLLHGLPASTIARWQARQRRGQPALQSPGPKKEKSADWTALQSQLAALRHGRCRTHGTKALQGDHREEISRRHMQQLVQEERDRHLNAMQRIQWLLPDTAWAIDATDYHGTTLVPVYDLASRYRFMPLISSRQQGEEIAAFLDQTFRSHGAPLFLKRDNGSPFNCIQVDAVLADYRVLPLNSPPHFPRYNGGMEKCIGDLKRRLNQKLLPGLGDPLVAAAAEATTHELNHKRRRCLRGKTACEIYHDPALRMPLNRRSREAILRLLMAEFCRNVQSMAVNDQRALAAVWRRTVETWLRCQGLISVGSNTKPNENVSTIFPKKWSHN